MESRGKQIKRKIATNEKSKPPKIASEGKESESKENERYITYLFQTIHLRSQIMFQSVLILCLKNKKNSCKWQVIIYKMPLQIHPIQRKH
jgi:hypothetical protein